VTFTVRGTILQTPTRAALEVLVDHLVTVDATGMIESVRPAAANDRADVTVPEGSYLLPGLVDLHVHAPQWPQIGTGYDLPLDKWLFEYTFPIEARCADAAFASQVWSSLVPSLLAGGTTTAVYYSSIHEPATLSLAQACVEHGQRAFVGRVAMDHPTGTPDYYRDASAAEAVAASQRSIEAITALGDPLVQPIITPRFIPACTDALLEGLGELAAATGVLVQTHCSENDWEHGYVLDRYGMTDTEALKGFGLLRDHAVLAHGVLIGADDQATIAAAGAGVAHCALSNVYFGNAVFPARAALNRGVRVGLGSDLAGGSEPGMLAQCAHAVNASRYLEDGVDPSQLASQRGTPDSRLSIAEAFWLATGGGAEVLGLPVGLLAAGHAFDAIAVATGPNRTVQRWPDVDDDERMFEKIVRRAQSRDITNVWVGGREVIAASGDVRRSGP